MGTVLMLLIALSVLHYAVVFYATLARKLLRLAMRQAARREAELGQPGAMGNRSGPVWPPQ